MKKTFLLTLFFGICALFGTMSAANDDALKYDIESAGSAVEGSYLVKVWVHSKMARVSDDELKHAAVHGVLFRGFHGKQGQVSQRPLAKSAVVEQQRADYFKVFFGEEGAYLQYATIVPGSYERVKMQKKGYKVGAVVQVFKDNLRRELQSAGIIQGLSSGF